MTGIPGNGPGNRGGAETVTEEVFIYIFQPLEDLDTDYTMGTRTTNPARNSDSNCCRN